MSNNGTYFVRTHRDNEPLGKDNPKVYPDAIFQFGSIDIELFAHEFESHWHATEKKTGCKVGEGSDMQAAMDDAHRVIDEYGGPEKFLKDNLESLFVEKQAKTYVTFKQEILPHLDLLYPVISTDRRHLRQEFPQ